MFSHTTFRLAFEGCREKYVDITADNQRNMTQCPYLLSLGLYIANSDTTFWDRLYTCSLLAQALRMDIRVQKTWFMWSPVWTSLGRGTMSYIYLTSHPDSAMFQYYKT